VGCVEATIGANEPRQLPIFHAPPGDVEAVVRCPIISVEKLFCVCSYVGSG